MTGSTGQAKKFWEKIKKLLYCIMEAVYAQYRIYAEQ